MEEKREILRIKSPAQKAVKLRIITDLQNIADKSVNTPYLTPRKELSEREGSPSRGGGLRQNTSIVGDMNKGEIIVNIYIYIYINIYIYI